MSLSVHVPTQPPQRLPLSDRTAEALIAVLLSDAADARLRHLRSALAEDPALREWARATAPLAENAPADELDPLAEWLAAADLPALLQQSSLSGDRAPSPREGQLLVLVERLARLADLETRFAETLEREKLAAMAEFAAGAGHEMNPPLAIISGRAQLFLRSETDPERRRELALINRQALRVHEMIADLMHFARPAQPRCETFDLAEQVAATVAGFEDRAVEQEIVLRCQGVGEPLLIEADRTQLAVALRAIVVNAFEALGQGGTIDVALSRTSQQAIVTIEDDGPSIPPEVRRHLFDPYYSGRGAGRGLGLGLSKCWRIVTAHRGTLQVDNPAPAQGARFTVTLPLGPR